MHSLVDRHFTVGISHKTAPDGIEIVVCCRNIWTQESLIFEYPAPAGFSEAVSRSSALARQKFHPSAGAEFDVVKCVVAHLDQYKHNVYPYSREFGGEMIYDALTFLLFYVQAFSIEMCGFIHCLSSGDREHLLRAIQADIPASNRDYSELLDARDLYRLYVSAFGVNGVLQSESPTAYR